MPIEALRDFDHMQLKFEDCESEETTIVPFGMLNPPFEWWVLAFGEEGRIFLGEIFPSDNEEELRLAQELPFALEVRVCRSTRRSLLLREYVCFRKDGIIIPKDFWAGLCRWTGRHGKYGDALYSYVGSITLITKRRVVTCSRPVYIPIQEPTEYVYCVFSPEQTEKLRQRIPFKVTKFVPCRDWSCYFKDRVPIFLRLWELYTAT